MHTKHKLIGVCGVRLYEQNIIPFLQILKDKAEIHGYRLVSFVGSSWNMDESDEIIGQYKLIELMENVELSALLILTETIRNERMIQKLVDLGKKKNIPVFSLDRKVEGCYSLLMDNGSCFEEIVRHVVEYHGCRYVNMISGDKGHSFSEERIAIYRRVLEENGIPFEEERVGYGNYWERPVAGVVQKMFDSDLPFPEAIVCANDIMAHAAISVLNEHGYEVPEDIIVTGYDDTKDGRIFMPSITTGGPDFELLIDFLFEKTEEFDKYKTVVPCDKTVPVRIKLRQSCGCEPKNVSKNDRRISKLLDEIGNGKWHMKSLNLMLDDSFGEKKLDKIFQITQKHMDIYFNFCRYICLDSKFLETYEVSEQFDAVTNMLEADYGKFAEPGTCWKVSDLQEQIERLLEKEKVELIQIHLLNSGKEVFGFMLEGIEAFVDWQVRHSNEFAMILAHIIQTTVYNYKMDEMNQNLSEANKEIEKMSFHDPMTKIYNRRGLFHQLHKLLYNKENYGRYMYMFFIDMDGLKYINDNFGHKEGDFAISTFANALSRVDVREKVYARIGGDEFICAFVEDKKKGYNADLFRCQLETLIQKSEKVSEKEYPITASVGMIEEMLSENVDLDAMINRADDCMYENKMKKKLNQNK